MDNIEIPRSLGDIELQPARTGKLKVSPDLQQTLALLSAFDGAVRRILKCNQNSVLLTTSPRSKQAFYAKATEDDYYYSPPSQVCNECIVKAHPDNVGRCYVQIDVAANPPTAYPLDAGDWIKLNPETLSNINTQILLTNDILNFFPTA